jgi:virginiamycin B lyase
MWANAPLIPGSGASDGRIVRISTSGSVSVFTTPVGSKGIAAGSDGNIWFGMGGSSGTTNYIGKVTPAGEVSAYPLPDLGTGVSSVTLGPDGNIWYVRITGLNNGTGKIGKITPGGVATEYETGTSIFPQTDVTLGPDGKVWFTDGANNILAEIDTSGNVSKYELPANTFPFSVATGSDNKIWFGNQLTIGKITNTPVAPPVVNPPINPNNPPKAPKSGKILGAVIATASLLSIVVLATLEVKKAKLETKNSTK